MSALSLRLPNSLHERARELARREGISINQLGLAEKMSALLTEEYLEARARRDSHQRFDAVRAALVACVGAVVVLLAVPCAAQPAPWPSMPAQVYPPPYVVEQTTDRIQSTLLEVRLAQTEKATNVEEATHFIDGFLRGSGRRFHLHKIPLVTNNDVIQARVVENRGTFDVDLTFSPEAAARMQIATSSHYGKPLAIIVNGELLAAPVVRETISSHLLIAAGFTRNEAQRIASGLQR